MRWNYRRTGALKNSVRLNTSGLPNSVAVTAGSKRGGGAPYAPYVEYVHFPKAGDLSFMRPAYTDIVDGNGYEPAFERLISAIERVHV